MSQYNFKLQPGQPRSSRTIRGPFTHIVMDRGNAVFYGSEAEATAYAERECAQATRDQYYVEITILAVTHHSADVEAEGRISSFRF